MRNSARFAGFLALVLVVAACATPIPGTTNAPGRSLPAVTASPVGAPTAAAGTPAAPPAAGLEACGIVTNAEVEAVIGSVVTAESGGPPSDGHSICTFQTANGEGVLYTAYDPDGVLAFDAWKTDSQTQTLPALGDEAYFHPSLGVMVRRGTQTFQFHLLTDDISVEDALDQGLRIAQAASARF